MKKKILFISHLANLSGAPIALCEIIRILKSSCHIDCDILIMSDGELKDEFSKYGNVYESWNRKNIANKIGQKLGNIYARFHYLKVAKEGKYDLVYANTIVSCRIARHIKDVLNIPFVLHLHESSFVLSIAGVKTEDLLQSEQVITVSQFAADALVSGFHYPADKIIISYPFSELAKRLLSYEDIVPKKREGSFVIGLAGTGFWIKAIDCLAILMDMYFKKHPHADCKFIWVGDYLGGERGKLEFELKKLGLIDKIELTGKVYNPEKYFRQFDVFLLLSREDSFPLVALENAALCKPIICFEGSSGATKWIQNGAGDIVPYMQLDDVVEAIYKYYINDDYKCEVGRNAREIVKKIYKENYSMKEVVDFINNYLS